MLSLPCRPRRSPCAIGLAILMTITQVTGASAAAIAWGKTGAFETCLESTLEPWLAAQAELEVNEDPAAGKLDDAAVAAWTLAAVAQCRARGGPADAESEARFTRHMAHWRQHIYDRAADIRKKGHSD